MSLFVQVHLYLAVVQEILYSSSLFNLFVSDYLPPIPDNPFYKFEHPGWAIYFDTEGAYAPGLLLSATT